MKKLFKSINLTSLILLLFVVEISAFAKAPRAVISSVKGNVFLLTGDSMKKLNTGDFLYEFDELFTEIGAMATIQDYYDNQFHLSGSGHIRVMIRLIELKSGYLWTQNLEAKKETFQIQTINAAVKYSSGEFVVSYDGENSKTQVLSIKGTHELTNLENRFMSTSVSSGYFSFISEKYESGNPRLPTEIGGSAYASILNLFEDVKPLNSESTKEFMASSPNKKSGHYKTARVPASSSVSARSEGEITIIRAPKVDEKRSKMLKNMYQSKVSELKKASRPKPKKFSIQYDKKTSVSLKVYRASKNRKPASSGVNSNEDPRKEFSSVRKPASIRELNPQVKVKKSAFEKSLLKQYKVQMRHSKEINSLINDLKSIDNDYDEAY